MTSNPVSEVPSNGHSQECPTQLPSSRDFDPTGRRTNPDGQDRHQVGVPLSNPLGIAGLYDRFRGPTMLPAYALWRLNWIHPVVEGNGRNGACSLLLPHMHETWSISQVKRLFLREFVKIVNPTTQHSARRIGPGLKGTSMSPSWLPPKRFIESSTSRRNPCTPEEAKVVKS